MDTNPSARHFHAPKLSPDQQAALEDLHRFAQDPRATRHALAGPAGSGKSYLIGQFLQACPLPIQLTATTNKAALVAERMAPGHKASTIHSLLGLKPEPDDRKGRMILRQNRDPKAKAGALVVVDEASMIDSELLTVIDKHARTIGFRVLYVGDSYQLPPVFESISPAFDQVPTSHLTTIHRQALDNPLIAAATGFRKVLDGEPFPYLEPRAPGVVLKSGPDMTRAMLGAFSTDEYRADGDYCRVLAWTNARVLFLNQIIRKHLLGPIAERCPYMPGEQFVVNSAIELDETSILPTEARVTVTDAQPAELVDPDTGINVSGWRVTVLKPETDYIPGDDEDEEEDHEARVFCPDDPEAAKALLGIYARKAQALQKECNRFPYGAAPLALDQDRRAAWREFFDVKRRFADLRPPHAQTVHKSQGSTYRYAFIDAGDIGRCTRSKLLARLLYVALTRPSETAIISGELPARLYQEVAA